MVLLKKLLIKPIIIYFQENLARRTFDESGNYTVRPFGIDIKEQLDDGSNDGVYKWSNY